MILPLHSTLFILVQAKHKPVPPDYPTLHSTLFILVPFVRPFLNCFHFSTFHSVYISTQMKMRTCAFNNTLHSTLFILVPNISGCPHSSIIHSTFHSVYISTPAFSMIRSFVQHSTFHSVYISTILTNIESCQLPPLHSTLFILVLAVYMNWIVNY